MKNELKVERDDPNSVYIELPYGKMSVHVDKVTGKAEINILTDDQIGIDFPFHNQYTVFVHKKDTVEAVK